MGDLRVVVNRTGQNPVLPDRTGPGIFARPVLAGPDRTGCPLQYGYQIIWSWAATCKKLVNFDISSLLKKFLNDF